MIGFSSLRVAQRCFKCLRGLLSKTVALNFSYFLSPQACNPDRPLQKSPGPKGPGIPKESPKSLRPSGRGVQKGVRNSLETVSGVSKQSTLRLRRLFRDCFGHFWTPGPEGSGRLFGDSFRIPGPLGPGDSCKGWPGLQPQAHITAPLCTCPTTIGHF